MWIWQSGNLACALTVTNVVARGTACFWFPDYSGLTVGSHVSSCFRMGEWLLSLFHCCNYLNPHAETSLMRDSPCSVDITKKAAHVRKTGLPQCLGFGVYATWNWCLIGIACGCVICNHADVPIMHLVTRSYIYDDILFSSLNHRKTMTEVFFNHGNGWFPTPFIQMI